MAATDGAPLLRVVSGSPTPEEIAAVVAVLAAASRARGEGEATPTFSRWSARESLVRTPLPAGRGAWRASGLPR